MHVHRKQRKGIDLQIYFIAFTQQRNKVREPSQNYHIYLLLLGLSAGTLTVGVSVCFGEIIPVPSKEKLCCVDFGRVRGCSRRKNNTNVGM